MTERPPKSKVKADDLAWAAIAPVLALLLILLGHTIDYYRKARRDLPVIHDRWQDSVGKSKARPAPSAGRPTNAIRKALDRYGR